MPAVISIVPFASRICAIKCMDSPFIPLYPAHGRYQFDVLTTHRALKFYPPVSVRENGVIDRSVHKLVFSSSFPGSR